MDILLYLPDNHEVSEAIRLMTATVTTVESIEVCTTVEHLSHTLRQPRMDLCVAILVVVSHRDLAALLAIRDLLYDIPLILILPDREKDTLAKAHTMRPRFVTHVDSDFLDFAAVLSKMLKKVRARTASSLEEKQRSIPCA